MLILSDVSAGYPASKGHTAVIERLSLRVGSGEVLAVLGPSGCGKSTLIHLLSGNLAPTGGVIEFESGGHTRPLCPAVHKIGVVPQNLGLLPWKSLRDNCLLPSVLRHEPLDAERLNEFDQILSELGIADLQDRYPNELSGGQRQRAAIARSFALRPDLLLMDEPFSSLDAINREEAAKLFVRVWRRARPTTVLVTHSIEEALFLGTSVAVMGDRGGRMAHRMENPFFAQPHPDSADYLHAARMLRAALSPSPAGAEGEGGNE